MSLASLPFLFGFLPLCLLVWQRVENRAWKNLFLAAVSWLFYAWAGLYGLALLLTVTVWTWLVCRHMDRRMFQIGVAVAVLVLLAYKYFASSLPLGLSFYIFSSISAMADVYAGKAAALSFVDMALYIGFFGKVGQGPIIQYRDMVPQLADHPVTLSDRGQGALRFVRGLAKKVLLADQLALIPGLLTQDESVLGAWLVAVGYSFQLYYDFSGYADMAIGCGRFFGFHLPENFAHPYMADSVRDFWHRWHMSLTRWFTTYVYIPLGGSRGSTPLTVRNILIVWVLTGLWHGSRLTFLVWGLYYGCLLVAERFWLGKYEERLPHWLRVVLMFLVAVVGWVFFQAESLGAAFSLLGRMFGLGALVSDVSLFALSDMWLLLLLSFVFGAPVYGRVQTVVLNRLGRKGMIGLAVFWMVVFVFCVAGIVSGSMRTFLYAAF